MSDQPVIYLDNAATTFPKPEAVYRQMDSFYRSFGGNAGRGANPLARRAQGLVNETRDLLQTWLGASEIVFTPSATVALNIGILGARLRRGDVVYVSPFEHNSVARPLERLRKTVGIEIRVLPFDRQTFACHLDRIRNLFRLEPPTMICITQVSNVFGLILPIEEIASIAREIASDVIVLVDSAQAAGLRPINMALIDTLIFSGHKSLYGPYGIAGIAFGTAWRPDTLLFGGTGTQSESLEMPKEGPSRYEAGSMNISAIAGLNAALCWLKDVGRETINAHVDTLTDQMRSALGDISHVKVYPMNKDMPSSGIVSFTIDSVAPQTMETALGAKNIAVRAGLHCAPWAHNFAHTLQLGGTVRTSVSYFNSSEHITYLSNLIVSQI